MIAAVPFLRMCVCVCHDPFRSSRFKTIQDHQGCLLRRSISVNKEILLYVCSHLHCNCQIVALDLITPLICWAQWSTADTQYPCVIKVWLHQDNNSPMNLLPKWSNKHSGYDESWQIVCGRKCWWAGNHPIAAEIGFGSMYTSHITLWRNWLLFVS